jgi:hypothetical protein
MGCVFNRTTIIVSTSSSATKHPRAWTAGYTKLTPQREESGRVISTLYEPRILLSCQRIAPDSEYPEINTFCQHPAGSGSSLASWCSGAKHVGNFRHCGITGPARVVPNVSPMAASPNSATRSRSSSAATPDGIFDEPEPESIDNISCSHISALLADPTESEPLLNTFRRVVTWKARRTHDALHSAKRRKVRLSIRIPVSPVHVYCVYR